MGDKSVKNRDWSGAIGQAARPLPEEAKKALKALKSSKDEAMRPLPEPVKKILKKKKQ